MTLSADFRRQAASALMHPVTLSALGVLLLNDLLFKVLWPGAWVPGKLSDLAWMTFAPPVLAFTLSFATLGNLRAQRAAFVAAFAALPLLYVAFNTLPPVHDAILRVLGIIGGDGPRSPLDPTDSLVIPFAMAAALWIWHRPPLEAGSIRARLALLATTTAALASVATSYATDRGVTDLGRTASGTLGTYTGGGPYVSMDGGLTWTKTSDGYVPLEGQDWEEAEVKDAVGAYFIVQSSPHIFRTGGPPYSREVIYTYEYLWGDGNAWMQALDKRDVPDLVIGTGPYDLFYDDESGNLIVAMGLQGVVVVAPDGTPTRVAVGQYSPTDFSFGGKVRALFASMLLPEMAASTGLALLLAFSFAALAVVGPAAPSRPKLYFALGAAISAFLAVSHGVYPHVPETPWANTEGRLFVGYLALMFSGLGLLPFLLVVAGLARARTSRRQLLAVGVVSIGMLLLVAVGALVLFETGTGIANFVAVGLVGLGALGVWADVKRAPL